VYAEVRETSRLADIGGHDVIELTGVRKVYRRGERKVCALDGVTLHVDAGEFIVIEGPSGSGKTTLLFTVAGLIRPTGGEIVIDNVTLTGSSAADLAEIRKKKFGFVFQMFHLIPYLTAAENVAVPMGLAGLAPAKAAKRARDLLDRFGLAFRADHYPAELSAGEKQRVAIARAVANRPPIVLADEPTGNLDHKAADDVFRAFEEIHADRTTLLVVTHDARMMERAPRVLRLEDGRLRG